MDANDQSNVVAAMGANDQSSLAAAMGGANGLSNLARNNGEHSMKKKFFHKSMGTAAGLRKLLPAGTTLAFETMAPSFTNGGRCSGHDDVHLVFTCALIGFLTFLSAALRFTDSITDRDGNTHYGVATIRGFKLFNCKPEDLQLSDDEWENLKRRMKLRRRDWLHAVLGAVVFGVLAFCDGGVQGCLVPVESRQWKDILNHLPLAVGFFASFVFMIWPSTRNGIGEAAGALDDDTTTEGNKSQRTATAAKKNRFLDKTVGTVAGLSKLLPTGTTLAFETMAPPFTGGGPCKKGHVHFIFTWGLIGFLTLLCAALSFTDSVTDKYGNTYYGVATSDGLLLFNHGDPEEDLRLSESDRRVWEHVKRTKKLKPQDFLLAFVSAAVFMVLAFCDAGVQRCLVPLESGPWKELLSVVPLAVRFLASFVFIVFPSNRLGIGKEGASSDGDDAAPEPAPAPAPGGQSVKNIKTTVSSSLQVQAMGITQVDPSTSYQLGTVC